MSKKAHKEIYVADLETSYKTKDNGRILANVWLCGYSRIETEKIHYFGTLKDFLKSLSNGESKTVYFHNLKFDGQFILYYYLSKRYKFVEYPQKENEISAIYTKENNIFSIVVSFKNGDKLRRIKFLDSFKLYPYSISKIAKQFGFEVQKGELNHDIYRPPNHPCTDEEIDYFNRDIIILRTAIEKIKEKGLNKITIGANSLEQYKEIIGKNNFKLIYPQLETKIDSFIRKAYKGGCCMLMEEHKEVINVNYSYDVNSMYPAVLAYEKMPFGNATFFKGKPVLKENELAILHIECCFNLKPKKLPCLQIKGDMRFGETEWVKESMGLTELYLTNIDYDMFMEHYYVSELTFIDGYKFRSKSGLFTKYIKYWYDIKQTTTDTGEREFAKLFLNNIYGKFGTNPKRTNCVLGLVNGLLKTIDKIDNEIETVYLPTAIFTTSYARKKLLSSAQLNYDNFVYCDTDSLHLLQPATNLEIDSKKLGAFKFEYSGEIKHLKQKTYIVKKDGKFDFKCAGLNKDYISKQGITVDFNNFRIGETFIKLKMRKCIGGLYPCKEEHKIK